MQTLTTCHSSRFLEVADILSVQIDHNTTCNLRCPQCARIYHGEINPNLEMRELSLEFYKKVFTSEFCKQLKFVLFCGNYGDAIASSNIVEVIEYLKFAGLRAISIFTNGSLRSAAWWSELGRMLNRPGDKVCFSIDGLSDTNPIYRRGSRFEKIIENARAFIEAGGRARWDYLVFEHNEHQVDEAKKLAEELGFAQFKLKKTNRFIQDKNYKSGKSSREDNVYQKSKSSQPVSVIKAPSKKGFQTKDISNFERIIKKHNTWFDYIDATPISCKAQSDRSIFIDFEGKLWPCTWLAAPFHFYGDDNTQKEQLEKLVTKYGNEFNDLHKHSLQQVLNHSWMGQDLEQSWKSKMTDPAFKLMTCGRTCGAEYEFSSNAAANREITEFNH